jgi:hypothetical protein
MAWWSPLTKMDLLEVGTEVDDGPDEREEHGQRGEVGRGEHRPGEQGDIDQRAPRPALPGDQRGHAGREHPHGGGSPAATTARLTHASADGPAGPAATDG